MANEPCTIPQLRAMLLIFRGSQPPRPRLDRKTLDEAYFNTLQAIPLKA